MLGNISFNSNISHAHQHNNQQNPQVSDCFSVTVEKQLLTPARAQSTTETTKAHGNELPPFKRTSLEQKGKSLVSSSGLALLSFIFQREPVKTGRLERQFGVYIYIYETQKKSLRKELNVAVSERHKCIIHLTTNLHLTHPPALSLSSALI